MKFAPQRLAVIASEVNRQRQAGYISCSNDSKIQLTG